MQSKVVQKLLQARQELAARRAAGDPRAVLQSAADAESLRQSQRIQAQQNALQQTQASNLLAARQHQHLRNERAASSAANSPSIADQAVQSPLFKHVRKVSQAENDELMNRRNPLYKPRPLSSDKPGQYNQALRRHMEAHGRQYPTPEAKEQQRALARYVTQESSPIDLQPFPSNKFNR